MKKQTLYLILSAIVLLVGAPLSPAAEPNETPRAYDGTPDAATPKGESRSFQQTIHIAFDPKSVDLDPNVLVSLHASVLDDAVEDACEALKLPEPPEQRPDVFLNLIVEADDHALCLLQIEETTGGPKYGDLLLTLMARHLEEGLRRIHEAGLRQVRLQLERARVDLDDAKAALEAIRQVRRQLCDKAGTTNLSQETVLKKVSELQSERERLEMELVGRRARQEALEKQIAIAQKTAQVRLRDDPVTVELEKVVSLRVQECKNAHAMHRTGAFPAVDVAAMETQLALARAELAKRRQEAAGTGGRELLAGLNTELVTLAIDIVEFEARQRAIAERLAKAREIVSLADEHERVVALPLRLAERDLEAAHLRIHETQRKARSLVVPTVTILAGD
jgi:hypothetical protein